MRTLQIATSLIMFMVYYIILLPFLNRNDMISLIVIMLLPALVILYLHILVVVSGINLYWLLGTAFVVVGILIFVFPGPSAHMHAILYYLKVGGEIWVKVHFTNKEEKEKFNTTLTNSSDNVVQHSTAGVFRLILLTKEQVYVQIDDVDRCSQIQKSLSIELVDCKETIGIPTSTIIALSVYSSSQFIPTKP